MSKPASHKDDIAKLLDDLAAEVDSNDDVRLLAHQLAALASNVAVVRLSEEQQRLELSDVLNRVAADSKRPEERKQLRVLAKIAKELAEYAEQLDYEDLSDEELAEVNELREELEAGLRKWWEAQ